MFNYLNRDISWLSFNERVSNESFRSSFPLQEQYMFQGIAGSNLDEFIQTRYPIEIDNDDAVGIDYFKTQVELHYAQLQKNWKTFNQPIDHYRVMSNVAVVDIPSKLSAIKTYFRKKVYPALQPVTLTGNAPMEPRNTVNVFVITEDDNTTYHNYIEIPQNLPRLVTIPGCEFVIPIEEIVMANLDYLFKGVHVSKSCAFRILRSAEVYTKVDTYADQYQMIEQTLKEREKSWITMLEIGSHDDHLVEAIKTLVPITDDTLVLLSDRMVNLSCLKAIPDDVFLSSELKRSHKPTNPFPKDGILKHIKASDRLVFHPFESYQDTFVRFIEEAAETDNVVSIKITLYRVASQSRIIDALIKAAENGKQVTVLVELKARFDEKHNIKISRILKEAGVRLVYGSPDLKTHAKLCLVTAFDSKGDAVIYSHIATGNYNESNAKLYTDYSYFTADYAIGHDLTRFFNLLTSVQEKFKSKKIFYAPYNLRDEIMEQIQYQVKRAKNHKSARIIFKCNSLTDDKIAKTLLDAAKAGVDITLIVRGACIVPHTDKIKVISIVGRFLEHSRIYLFGDKDDERIYIGSNDIMHRNLNRRNELMLMVEPPELKDRIKKHLMLYLTDTENCHTRIEDYLYQEERIFTKRKNRVDCHKEFQNEAKSLTK